MYVISMKSGAFDVSYSYPNPTKQYKIKKNNFGWILSGFWVIVFRQTLLEKSFTELNYTAGKNNIKMNHLPSR